MRILTRFAASCLALGMALALPGCGLERHATPAAPALAAPAAEADASQALPSPPRIDALSVARQISVLVNDTDPSSPDWARLRAELVRSASVQAKADDQPLPGDLLRAIARIQAFTPPQLRERWQQHQQALDSAAALYAAHPPVDTDALRGASVLRRLGPALYLVRLSGGDTAFFSTPLGARRLKAGMLPKGIPVLERPHVKADRSSGDLVEELADSARTFVALSKHEALKIAAERAPVLTRLKELEAEQVRFQRSIDADLANLDSLVRDVNAVVGPRLLGLGASVADGRRTPIRQTKHLAHRYSSVQYYRYALPVTGNKQLDAVLREYIEDRKKDVLDLLRSVGVGRGRARANVDLVGFQSFVASPGLLSIRFESSRDTGGAHPNQGFASFVFDLPSQTVLGLGDLFRNLPAALGLLSELAARRMELVLDGHVFPEGNEPKAENFAVFVLDGQDLVFTFPPYQMASYADGAQTLRVPLAHPRLLPLLSPKLLEALGAQPGQERPEIP
jgi:hypothetical protein